MKIKVAVLVVLSMGFAASAPVVMAGGEQRLRNTVVLPTCKVAEANVKQASQEFDNKECKSVLYDTSKKHSQAAITTCQGYEAKENRLERIADQACSDKRK